MLNDVLHFYVQNSQLAGQALLRNAPMEFQGMSLTDADIANLVESSRHLPKATPIRRPASTQRKYRQKSHP
jgi:hypothetical protein